MTYNPPKFHALKPKFQKISKKFQIFQNFLHFFSKFKFIFRGGGIILISTKLFNAFLPKNFQNFIFKKRNFKILPAEFEIVAKCKRQSVLSHFEFERCENEFCIVGRRLKSLEFILKELL